MCIGDLLYVLANTAAAQVLVANAGQETAAAENPLIKHSHPLATTDIEIVKYV